jgi:coenzyme PQQ precursor peptide PqqA
MKIMRRESAICAGRSGRRSGQWVLKLDAALPIRGPLQTVTSDRFKTNRGENAMWTKPEFTEMRFGFEVTMYIYNR